MGTVAVRGSHHWSDDPLTLPATLGGLSPLDPSRDFGQGTSWRASQEEHMQGASFTGRAYGGGTGSSQLPRLNLVLARRDTTGFGDVHLVTDPHLVADGVSCSSTFPEFGARDGDGAPATTTSMRVCWRSSSRLTVSVLSLGSQVSEEVTAGAVSEAWRQQP